MASKVQLDNDMGSAIVHESNIEIISYSEGPVDQRTKDERTALRRAKIQEKRSQLLVQIRQMVGVGKLDRPLRPWKQGRVLRMSDCDPDFLKVSQSVVIWATH